MRELYLRASQPTSPQGTAGPSIPMSTTAKVSSQKPGAPSFRNLPAVMYFEGDDTARAAIAGLQHFLRLSFDEFSKGRDSETILVTSQERMIVDKAPILRAP